MSFFDNNPFGEHLFVPRRINRFFDVPFSTPSFFLEFYNFPEESCQFASNETCPMECCEAKASKPEESVNSNTVAEQTADKNESTEAAIAPTGNSKTMRLWNPSFNVSETDKHLVVSAEIPGVDKNDVAVEVKDGVLTVHGEKKEEKRSESEKFHRVERKFGSFSRSFRLPEGANPEKHVTAKFENGILEVLVEKPEVTKKESETKTIEIV